MIESEKYPQLTEAIVNAPSIMITGNDGRPYPFQVFPFGERGTRVKYELIREIGNGLVEKIRRFGGKFDYLCSIAPGGNAWALLIGLGVKTDVKLSWVRGNSPLDKIRFPDELEIPCGGPHGRVICFRAINPCDQVIIFDDVVSTGESVKAVVKALREAGAVIEHVFSIVTKGETYKEVEQPLAVKVSSLINLTEDGQLIKVN